jgi:hypothetical protein
MTNEDPERLKGERVLDERTARGGVASRAPGEDASDLSSPVVYRVIDSLWSACLIAFTGIFTAWSYRAGSGRAEAFLLNPQPLPARTAHEWGVVAEVVPNGRALSRARELAALYLEAPEVTRRGAHIHFIQPLKERIVREVGYGLSVEGASSAALIRSKQTKSEPGA